MTSAGLRRHILLALPFFALWALGVFAYSHFNLVVHDHGIVREARPYEWVPYGLPRVTIEVAVLYLLLRPGTFRWSWGRVLTALVFFIAWMGYNGGFGFHSPGWVWTHSFWLLGVCAALLVLLIVCGIGAWWVARRPVPA